MILDVPHQSDLMFPPPPARSQYSVLIRVRVTELGGGGGAEAKKNWCTWNQPPILDPFDKFQCLTEDTSGAHEARGGGGGLSANKVQGGAGGSVQRDVCPAPRAHRHGSL